MRGIGVGLGLCSGSEYFFQVTRSCQGCEISGNDKQEGNDDKDRYAPAGAKAEAAHEDAADGGRMFRGWFYGGHNNRCGFGVLGVGLRREFFHGGAFLKQKFSLWTMIRKKPGGGSSGPRICWEDCYWNDWKGVPL